MVSASALAPIRGRYENPQWGLRRRAATGKMRCELGKMAGTMGYICCFDTYTSYTFGLQTSYGEVTIGNLKPLAKAHNRTTGFLQEE